MSDATFQLGAFLDDAGDRTDEAVAYAKALHTLVRQFAADLWEACTAAPLI